MTAIDILYFLVTAIFSGLAILLWICALVIADGWQEVKKYQGCKHDDVLYFEDERVYYSCRCCGRTVPFFDNNETEDCPGDVLGYYKEDR